MALVFVWFFFVTIGLLLLAAPLFIVAWRRHRPATIRNFAIAAAVIGLASGSLAGISDRQTEQCLDAGLPDCFDSGTAGLQLLFVGLYLLAAWFAAYTLYRD